jgi:hypothetical protein
VSSGVFRPTFCTIPVLIGFKSAAMVPIFARMGSILLPFPSPGWPISPPPVQRWLFVRQRFTQFLANLNLTVGQAGDGVTKHAGVVATLNRAYRNVSEGSTNRILIGSWAKGTRVRPPRDIDLLFILPVDVYYRFQQRQGNVQSQLLQEVRDVLRVTYPTTDIRGDDPIRDVSGGSRSSLP